MNNDFSKKDLTQVTLSILFILLFIGGSVWIFKPFVAALIWASIIVISTYNFMLKLQKLLWNKKSLAITAMLLLILMTILVPIAIVVVTIINNIPEIHTWLLSLAGLKSQPLPDWLRGLPLIGNELEDLWQKFTSSDDGGFAKSIIPLLDDIFRWFVAQAGSFGIFMIHFLVTVVICGILYSKGELALTGIRNFAARLAGERGTEIITLSGQAIKAVTLGVVITALIQSVLGGIGLAVAGVPRTGLLTALMFILGISQIGAAPVLIPAVIWKYASGDPVWGSVLLVWTIIVGGSDNIIRPYLIKRGANLPILLIFSGVIGGLIAFGIVGLFIGPVVLAITYTLLKAWVNEGRVQSVVNSASGKYSESI